ncbi:MAG: hypothetical protein AMXMBFR8_27820 [Nevskiales bacterium]
MEVVAQAFGKGQPLEEQVHEERLAAPDAAPQIGATHRRCLGRNHAAPQPRHEAGGGWSSYQVRADPLQRIDCPQLRGIVIERFLRADCCVSGV